MLKFQAQEWSTRIRTALATALPALTAKVCLYKGVTPDLNAAAHSVGEFELPVGGGAQPQALVLGVIHHHDADYDAVHIQPVEFHGDDGSPDEVITGYFLAPTPDDETTNVLFAEEFDEPRTLQNALSAFTVAPIMKIPRRGDMFSTTILD